MNSPDTNTVLPSYNFIVGCPRSGTSVVQRLIASHPQIVTGPESLFFKDLYLWNAPDEGGWITPSRRYQIRVFLYRVAFCFGRGNPYARKRLVAMLRDIKSDPRLVQSAEVSRSVVKYVDCFCRGMDALASRENALAWIEKTPDHVNYIRQISRHLPDAKFIHVLRNGRDAVASLYDASLKYPGTHWASRYCSVERCCDRWNRCASESLRYINDAKHTIVRLEDFVDKTEESLHAIDRFLGVEIRTYSEDIGTVDAPQVSRQYEQWKGSVYDKPRRPENKFRRVFDKQTQERILETTGLVQSHLDAALAIQRTPSSSQF